MDAMRIGRELSAGLVFLLLLGGGPSCAQFHGRGAEVRVVSPVQIVSEPSRMHTISIEVTNRTNRQERFREDVILPKGWGDPHDVLVLPHKASTAHLCRSRYPLMPPRDGRKSNTRCSPTGIRPYGARWNTRWLSSRWRTDLMVENPPASLMAGRNTSFPPGWSIRATPPRS